MGDLVHLRFGIILLLAGEVGEGALSLTVDAAGKRPIRAGTVAGAVALAEVAVCVGSSSARFGLCRRREAVERVAGGG